MPRIKVDTIGAAKMDDIFQGQQLSAGAVKAFRDSGYELGNYRIDGTRTNEKAYILDTTNRRKFLLLKADNTIEIYFVKKKKSRVTELSRMSADEKQFIKQLEEQITTEIGIKKRALINKFKLQALMEYRDRRRKSLSGMVGRIITKDLAAIYGNPKPAKRRKNDCPPKGKPGAK